MRSIIFLDVMFPDHVFDAMVSVVYNCGAGSLKWKWAQACKAGDYHRAADLLRVTAITGGGVKLAGLVKRRKMEANLLEHGLYSIDVSEEENKVSPADAMSDGILMRGERGQAVSDLIDALGSLGHYTGVRDDIFGQGVYAAVIDFQRAHGLSVDGIAGPATLAEIKRLTGKKSGRTKQVAGAVGVGVIGGLIAFWEQVIGSWF